MQESSEGKDVLTLDFSQVDSESLATNLLYSKVEWKRKIGEFLKTYNESEEFISYTSGTTGTPKEVVHTKFQLQYSAKKTLSFFGLHSGDPVLSPLNVDFIAGKLMLVRALEGRLHLTIVKASANPFDLLVDKQKFKFSVLVPYQLSRILSTTPELINNLGVILLGGADIRDGLVEQLQERKVKSYSSFGMTETMTHFALRSLSPVEEKWYHCIDPYKIRVDNLGCIIVSNPEVFSAPIHTSDCAELLSETEFRWLGRKDNVINSAGVKLSVEQIEAKLKKAYPQWPSFIIGKDSDPEFGERPVLVFEQGSEVPESALHAAAEVLDPYEKPAAICMVRVFEYTSSGKVKRQKLIYI